jgi:MFS family permease
MTKTDSRPPESSKQSMDHLPPASDNPPPSQGFGPVLSNGRFLLLWTGQVFSQIADRIYLVLIIALVASHFQAADQPISGWVSAIMIAFTIPAVLFGSLAGVYVDRWSKKAVMVVSNLVRGALVLTIPPLLWLSDGQKIAIPLHWLPETWRHWQYQPQEAFYVPLGFLILLLQTFIESTITQFFAPAEQATIPLLVKRRHLLPANSLFTTTMMGTLILGFAIGEPLLEFAGSVAHAVKLPWDLGKVLVVAGSYAIAGIILLFLRIREKDIYLNSERPHPLEDIRDGINYLRQNRRVRNALIQLIILFSIFAALSVLAVRLAEMVPGLKAQQFGFILAVGGVGIAIGAAFVGNIGSRISPLYLSLWGSLGIGASLVLMSLSTGSLWMALLSTTLLGLFAALVGVPMQTAIQAETPSDMRGKVFGLQNNAVNIALSLPLAVAGIAETRFGLRSVLLSLAILSICGGLFTWYLSLTTVVRSNKIDK